MLRLLLHAEYISIVNTLTSTEMRTFIVNYFKMHEQRNYLDE